MAIANECFKCGVSGDKVRLYDAISGKGIVKICGDCNATERLPIIRKPGDIQAPDSQRQKSVRDMLASKGKMTAGREPTLRELVDRNLKERLSKQPSDLIDNFQWAIQRTRRNRKITREQFSKGIGESEATVRMLESGVLPNNDYKIIGKVESFLGIQLKKRGDSKLTEPPTSTFRAPQTQPRPQAQSTSRGLGFDRSSRSSTEGMKIADLRDMKKTLSDSEKSRKPIDSWEEETSQDDEKFLDAKDNPDNDFFDDEGEK